MLTGPAFPIPTVLEYTRRVAFWVFLFLHLRQALTAINSAEPHSALRICLYKAPKRQPVYPPNRFTR